MHEMYPQPQGGASESGHPKSEQDMKELEVLEREIQELEQAYMKERMRIKWLKKLILKYNAVANYAHYLDSELPVNEEMPSAKAAWELFAWELQSDPSYEAVRETTIGRLDFAKEFERAVRDDDYDASQATVMALITMARKRQEDIDIKLKPLYEKRTQLDPVAEGTFTGIGARQQEQVNALLREHAGTKPMPKVGEIGEDGSSPVL